MTTDDDLLERVRRRVEEEANEGPSRSRLPRAGRTRVGAEMRQRTGTGLADYLKLVLSIIDRAGTTDGAPGSVGVQASCTDHVATTSQM